MEDPRYNFFNMTGPIGIPRTRDGREIKSGVAAVVRRHIETKHCGQFQFRGLYVVSYEDSVAWFGYPADDTEG
ncbi:uncharacterized protein N7496_012233 [Penicillium cataractarum]|uniref:Uncharacterized protein n=1 Tax=Penicillium cataractarum TaxID=2100454 RepID=A0A9W9R7H3_9EURO|nr:uncharacterized protein N7496_012233 [Penicillium cataractarum]KAJ5355021.1 hypothetical protein N7496_012233 [Penicillium cataractarum]